MDLDKRKLAVIPDEWKMIFDDIPKSTDYLEVE
jgi:hypothetical protein